MNQAITELLAISIDMTEFEAAIIILVVALALIGMIAVGVQRTRSVKRADKFTHDRVEDALHKSDGTKVKKA